MFGFRYNERYYSESNLNGLRFDTNDGQKTYSPYKSMLSYNECFGGIEETI